MHRGQDKGHMTRKRVKGGVARLPVVFLVSVAMTTLLFRCLLLNQ